jgi:outer membrane protein assembly factor BamD
MNRNAFRYVLVLALAVGLLSSCGFRRKKYENPITKDTQQPDKVLFDKAIADIERSRFEIARLTLQTLINTYDTSEYLAKAKLAIADSWFREGGAHGLAQAEAEYKDFKLFYPNMEEAAEAQEKVCDIQYNQMEKPDRDTLHALRAEDECRQALVEFPNSKRAPEIQQKLRNIQEALADGEFRRGSFYHNKGSYPAAANRLQGLADQFPLYSGADEALWNLGDSYTRMGDRFEDRAAEAYTRIVRDYPLSVHVDQAKEKLTAMNRPVPQADPVARARMQYELENRENPGFMHHVLGILRTGPDVHLAAKSGTPVMTAMQPGVPLSVPPTAAGAPGPQGAGGVSADVSVSTVTDSTALDTNPDARRNPPAPPPPPATVPPAPAGAPAGVPTPDGNTGAALRSLPTNHPTAATKGKKAKKETKKKKNDKTDKTANSESK